MAEGGGQIDLVHDIVVIRFHGKGEIITHDVLLAEKFGRPQRLGIRIIPFQAGYGPAKAAHLRFGLLLHVPAVNKTSLRIPLHDSGQRIGLLHHVISERSNLLRAVLLPSRLSRPESLIEGRDVIKEETVERHDEAHHAENEKICRAVNPKKPKAPAAPPMKQPQHQLQRCPQNQEHRERRRKIEKDFPHGEGKQPGKPSIGFHPHRENMGRIKIAEPGADPSRKVQQHGEQNQKSRNRRFPFFLQVSCDFYHHRSFTILVTSSIVRRKSIIHDLHCLCR